MSRCRSCDAEVLWAANGHQEGSAVLPVDPVARPDGNVFLERTASDLVARVLTREQVEACRRSAPRLVELHVVHFGTCPSAGAHRRSRADLQGGIL